jgi:hypothetical protein
MVSGMLYQKTKSQRSKMIFLFSVVQFIVTMRGFIYFTPENQFSPTLYYSLLILQPIYLGLLPLMYLLSINTFFAIPPKALKFFKYTFLTIFGTSLLLYSLQYFTPNQYLFSPKFASNSSSFFMQRAIFYLGGAPTPFYKIYIFGVAILNLLLSITVIKTITSYRRDKLFTSFSVISLGFILYSSFSWIISMKLFIPIYYVPWTSIRDS